MPGGKSTGGTSKVPPFCSEGLCVDVFLCNVYWCESTEESVYVNGTAKNVFQHECFSVDVL